MDGCTVNWEAGFAGRKENGIRPLIPLYFLSTVFFICTTD
jgi:hypothetical protein